jgi:hypothetical protein
MIYCQKCGYRNPEDAPKCVHCGEDLSRKLLGENERPLVQKLHQQENVARERKDTAMSFIVLGSIFVILGALFFILSFKLPYAAAAEKVLIVTCFEFWVSIIALVLGFGGLTYGFVLLGLNLKKLRIIRNDIAYIREHQTPVVPNKGK